MCCRGRPHSRSAVLVPCSCRSAFAAFGVLSRSTSIFWLRIVLEPSVLDQGCGPRSGSLLRCAFIPGGACGRRMAGSVSAVAAAVRRWFRPVSCAGRSRRLHRRCRWIPVVGGIGLSGGGSSDRLSQRRLDVLERSDPRVRERLCLGFRARPRRFALSVLHGPGVCRAPIRFEGRFVSISFGPLGSDVEDLDVRALVSRRWTLCVLYPRLRPESVAPSRSPRRPLAAGFALSVRSTADLLRLLLGR